MRAQVGDRIILAAEHIDQPTRDGEVLEVRGADGGPPFFVRWSDGHTGLIYPGPGAILRIGSAEHEAPAPPSAPPVPPVPTSVPVTGTAGAGSGTATHATAPGHIREWNIRVTIFESGDDTSATVVLLADAPEQLSARGTSHRSSDDNAVPEIGDEVAVARALRHLADQLLHVAEQDIEDLTGEDAHVRPV